VGKFLEGIIKLDLFSHLSWPTFWVNRRRNDMQRLPSQLKPGMTLAQILLCNNNEPMRDVITVPPCNPGIYLNSVIEKMRSCVPFTKGDFNVSL